MAPPPPRGVLFDVVIYCRSNADSFLWIGFDFQEEGVLLDVVPARQHLVGHKPANSFLEDLHLRLI